MKAKLAPRKMVLVGLLLFSSIFFLASPESLAQGQQRATWTIWMKTSPCSGHPTEWLTVSDRNPNVGGLATYVPYPQRPTVFATFGLAMEARNASLSDPTFKNFVCGGGEWKIWMRVAPCCPDRIQWVTVSNRNPSVGGLDQYEVFPNSGSFLTFEAAQAASAAFRAQDTFKNYCCRDRSLWKNQDTLNFALTDQFSAPSGLGWIKIKTQLCCEEALLLAGPKAGFSCGGGTSGSGGLNSCFGNDPGAGSTNWPDHYGWASQRDVSVIQNNVTGKAQQLFNCRSLADSDMALYYGELSAIIARSAPDPACYRGDAGAANPDPAGHSGWARGRSRLDLANNLIAKIRGALACLDHDRQARLFADLSVSMAKAAGGGLPPGAVISSGGLNRPIPSGAIPSGGITAPPGGGFIPPPAGTQPSGGVRPPAPAPAPAPAPTPAINWNGSWADSTGTINISGGGNSISASFSYQTGTSKGQGSWSGCVVSGNQAKCKWTSNYEDDVKTGTRSGTLEVTIAGDTITGSYLEDTPQFTMKPGQSQSYSSMHKGAVWPISVKRRQ